MIYIITFVCFILTLICWKLSRSLEDIQIDLEYLRYSTIFLGCNDYYLLSTLDGRDISLEEEAQLAFAQTEVSQEAYRTRIDGSIS